MYSFLQVKLQRSLATMEKVKFPWLETTQLATQLSQLCLRNKYRMQVDNIAENIRPCPYRANFLRETYLAIENEPNQTTLTYKNKSSTEPVNLSHLKRRTGIRTDRWSLDVCQTAVLGLYFQVRPIAFHRTSSGRQIMNMYRYFILGAHLIQRGRKPCLNVDCPRVSKLI